MKKGFTLIELLVVVLIIGILAAIAVPQYQKTTEKARAAEAFTLLRALTDAEKIYILENSAPTNKIDELSIEIPGEKIAVNKIETKDFIIDIRNLNGGFEGAFEIVATRKNPGNNDRSSYYIYRHYGDYFVCVSLKEAAKQTCNSLGITHGHRPRE